MALSDKATVYLQGVVNSGEFTEPSEAVVEELPWLPAVRELQALSYAADNEDLILTTAPSAKGFHFGGMTYAKMTEQLNKAIRVAGEDDAQLLYGALERVNALYDCVCGAESRAREARSPIVTVPHAIVPARSKNGVLLPL